MQENRTSQINNKRIAKNAIYLYLRMFVTMWITLYTSRFLLNVLGVEDYGLYNVVGGIAVLFSFISNSLLLSSERYIASSITKASKEHIQRTFSSCLNCHILISLILLIFAESIGLWLINTQVVLPEDRLFAANCVYQFSVFSCVIGVINSPYHAAVIAYEKFDFNAVEGILLTIFKLLILLLVYFSSWDSLIFYAWLLCSISIIQLLMNLIYCKYMLYNIQYIKCFDKRMSYDIFKFAGWNMFKNGAFVIFNQGTNLGFNIFGSVVINAAYGVAMQVYGACMSFMHGVQNAFYPQIIKSCAAKDYDGMNILISRAAKFSFFMILFIGTPLTLNMNYILDMWLGTVPEHTVEFCIVIIIVCYLESIIEPLNTAIMTNGLVKNYVFLTAFFWLISVTLVFLMLYLGIEYYICLSIRIVVQLIIMFCTTYLLHRYVRFPYKAFFIRDCLPLLVIMISSIIIPKFLSIVLGMDVITNLVISSTASWGIMFLMIYNIGLSVSERKLMCNYLRRLLNFKR